MIDDILFIMSTQTDMRNVEIDVNVEEGLTVYCNASQIKQVLINLIKNGAEAMQKSGKITIGSRKTKEYVAIDITDEGQGVPESVMKELNRDRKSTRLNSSHV